MIWCRERAGGAGGAGLAGAGPGAGTGPAAGRAGAGWVACGRSFGLVFFSQRGSRFARRFLVAARCAWEEDFLAFLRFGLTGVQPGFGLRRLRFRDGLPGGLTPA